MASKPSREVFEAFFREADTDGSGDLDLEELTVMLRSKGFKGSDDDIKEYFHKLDMSMDNKISLEEYLIGLGFVPNLDPTNNPMRRLFEKFDTDGNGEIDRDELKSIFKSMGKYLPDHEIDRMIQLVSNDGSKSINYDQFTKYLFGSSSKDKK